MKRILQIFITVTTLFCIHTCEKDDDQNHRSEWRVNNIIYSYSNGDDPLTNTGFSNFFYEGTNLKKQIYFHGEENFSDTSLIFEYNYNNQYIDNTIFDKIDNKWQAIYKYEYETDGFNVKSIINRDLYVSEGHGGKYEFIYNNDQIAQYTYSYLDAQNWILQREYILEYADRRIEKIDEYWVWDDGTKYKRISTEWFYVGDMIDYILSTNTVDSGYKTYYTYTDSRISLIEIYLEPEGTLYGRKYYTYNDNGNLESYTYKFYQYGNLESTSKETYEYEPGCGNYQIFDEFIDWKVYTRPYVDK